MLLHFVCILLLGIVLNAPVFGLTVSVRTADGDSVFYAGLADTVALDVSLDSEGEVLTGFELFLAYDPAVFLPVDTDLASPGNQPVVSAGVFGQVFADSIIVFDGSTSVIHFAEVDIIGSQVSGRVFSVQYVLVGSVSGTSSIRVLQDLAVGFSSLYTTSDRDGESVTIAATVGAVYQDLPPKLRGLDNFEIEEDGGPAVLLADLVSDESPMARLVYVVAMDDSATTAFVDGDSLRFITPDDFAGAVSGLLTVTDPGGGEDAGQITLTVTPVNDAPDITDTSFPDTLTVGDEAVRLELVGRDVDDEPGTLLWFALVMGDSLHANVSGTELTLTSMAGWNGTASLMLQLADPGGLVDTLAITIQGTAVPGDFDGNGAVDFGDFLMFAEAFGNPDADNRFDLDGSGAVDFPDFLIFVEGFGT